MTMPALEPASVLVQVMHYDPQDYKDMQADELRHLQQWLGQNEEKWLYEFRRPILEDTTGRRIVVVVGEAGSGKTTLMNLTARALGEKNVVLHFDLKNAPGLAPDMRREDASGRIAKYLHDGAEAQLQSLGLGHELETAVARLVLREKSHASLTKLRLAHPDVYTWPSERLRDDQNVRSALIELSGSIEASVTIQAAQLLPARRTILIFDNVDGLPQWLIETVLRAITAIQRGTSLVLVAIRAENQQAAGVLFNGTKDNVIHLDQDGETLIQITRTRSDGALEYVQQFSPSGLAEAIARRDAIEKAVTGVLKDGALLSISSRWLNGNVRQWLTLMAELSVEIRNSQDVPRSLNGIVMSQMVARRHPSRLYDILQAKRVHSRKYPGLPFVFLPLRILVYIANHYSKAPQRKLIQDFGRNFGIDEERLRTTIDMLCEARAGSPSLMRRAVEADGRVTLVLLPCGETFVAHVVYSVDYLAEIYLRVPTHAKVPDAPRRSTLKLRRAMIVVRELLIPAFVAEHPYISAERPISAKELVRLSAYEDLFNYGEGTWFLERLRARLVNYARARWLYREVEELDLELQAIIRRLDDLASNS